MRADVLAALFAASLLFLSTLGITLSPSLNHRVRVTLGIPTTSTTTTTTSTTLPTRPAPVTGYEGWYQVGLPEARS